MSSPVDRVVRDQHIMSHVPNRAVSHAAAAAAAAAPAGQPPPPVSQSSSVLHSPLAAPPPLTAAARFTVFQPVPSPLPSAHEAAVAAAAAVPAAAAPAVSIARHSGEFRLVEQVQFVPSERWRHAVVFSKSNPKEIVRGHPSLRDYGGSYFLTFGLQCVQEVSFCACVCVRVRVNFCCICAHCVCVSFLFFACV